MKFKTIALDKCSQPNLRNTPQEKKVELHMSWRPGDVWKERHQALSLPHGFRCYESNASHWPAKMPQNVRFTQFQGDISLTWEQLKTGPGGKIYCKQCESPDIFLYLTIKLFIILGSLKRHSSKSKASLRVQSFWVALNSLLYLRNFLNICQLYQF